MSIYELPSLLIYCCVLAALLGAVMGSFLHCAAWRIARNEPFWKGRSHCSVCGHTLGVRELVPVFSWLLQRGRCRHCQAAIPKRYPLAELAFALMTVLTLLKFDLTVITLRNWILLCCLFCLSLVDLETCIIPDGCLLIAAASWGLALPFLGWCWLEIGRQLAAGLFYGSAMLGISLLLDRVLQRESLGGGDIKLFALVGLYLGWLATLFAIILACVLGLLFGAVYNRKVGESGAFPFGPAIALSVWVMLLYGDPLTHWYLGLF